jgi:hypothetical protein
VTFRILQSVVVERDLPEHGLRKGDRGAVMLVHSTGDVLVDFARASQTLVELRQADVRAVEDDDRLDVQHAYIEEAIKYSEGRLSPEAEVAFLERMREDGTFRRVVVPVLDAWKISRSPSEIRAGWANLYKRIVATGGPVPSLEKWIAMMEEELGDSGRST